MKHLIIGSGVVGKATGIWLESNSEDVTFNDINTDIVKDLKNAGHKTTSDIKQDDADIYWVCTAEWDTESVIKQLFPIVDKKGKIVVIRSTTPPGTTKELQDTYKIKLLAHNPEFLRANTAIKDMFHPDRVIIGINGLSSYIKEVMQNLYSSVYVPLVFTDTTTSELIKYASNCWLATQISYWNEIRKICIAFNVNPQEVANAACLDKRISRYGSTMLGHPFKGQCLPKDIDSLIRAFEDRKLKSILLKAVKSVNEGLL